MVQLFVLKMLQLTLNEKVVVSHVTSKLWIASGKPFFVVSILSQSARKASVLCKASVLRKGLCSCFVML
jgi:hypothetical protein